MKKTLLVNLIIYGCIYNFIFLNSINLYSQVDALTIVPLYHVPGYPGFPKRSQYFLTNIGYYNATGNNLLINGLGVNFNIATVPSSWGAVFLGTGFHGLFGKTPEYDTCIHALYEIEGAYYSTNSWYHLPNGKSNMFSLWLPMFVHWEFQPFRIGRMSTKIIWGGRIFYGMGSNMKVPITDTAGQSTGVAPRNYELKFGDFLAVRGNGYIGAQVGLPLSKLKIAPFIFHYGLGKKVGAENKTSGWPGGYVLYNKKQHAICIGAEIVNPKNQFGLAISYTRVPKKEFEYFGNVDALVGDAAISTAYNMINVSINLYSSTQKIW